MNSQWPGLNPGYIDFKDLSLSKKGKELVKMDTLKDLKGIPRTI